jgi:hypothetical protein
MVMFKGTTHEFIRKTICIASFHFSTINASSRCFFIGAKISTLAKNIGAHIPNLTSFASLASQSFIFDLTPLLAFSINTTLRLLNERTGFQYSGLQKAAHLTEVVSNKLEVI